MFDKLQFELIKKKYGHYSSWAIWAEEGERSKDNVGDLKIFDLQANPSLIQILNPNIILVGLNISRRIEYPLGNFHDPSSRAMDYKIRYALKGSSFWGAYMTDVIKDFEQKASGELLKYLRANKQFELENIKVFLEEVKDLGAQNPTIIAFGKHAYEILFRNLKNNFNIKKIPHYSNNGSKEKYAEEVRSISRSLYLA